MKFYAMQTIEFIEYFLYVTIMWAWGRGESRTVRILPGVPPLSSAGHLRDRALTLLTRNYGMRSVATPPPSWQCYCLACDQPCECSGRFRTLLGQSVLGLPESFCKPLNLNIILVGAKGFNPWPLPREDFAKTQKLQWNQRRNRSKSRKVAYK